MSGGSSKPARSLPPFMLCRCIAMLSASRSIFLEFCAALPLCLRARFHPPPPFSNAANFEHRLLVCVMTLSACGCTRTEPKPKPKARHRRSCRALKQGVLAYITAISPLFHAPPQASDPRRVARTPRLSLSCLPLVSTPHGQEDNRWFWFYFTNILPDPLPRFEPRGCFSFEFASLESV